MINLKITMTDGSDIIIKSHAVTSAIEFVRLSLKPSGVPIGWIEVIRGTVINVANIRSIEEISEGEVEKANELIEGDIVVLPWDKENDEITPEGEVIDKAPESEIEEPAQTA